MSKRRFLFIWLREMKKIDMVTSIGVDLMHCFRPCTKQPTESSMSTFRLGSFIHIAPLLRIIEQSKQGKSTIFSHGERRLTLLIVRLSADEGSLPTSRAKFPTENSERESQRSVKSASSLTKYSFPLSPNCNHGNRVGYSVNRFFYPFDR